MKGANVEKQYFFSVSKDMSSSYSYTAQESEGDYSTPLLELLDFCDQEQIRVLFVASPSPGICPTSPASTEI